ncbi:helix-turn-helix domain-containing protein [Nonomuraea sp. NPDC050663]|uniref:helix-turn-helix domain-containing protein n=1 Tax=Nonomuraea sp. NPDC050663 TaxID=3364370 RepID=UPI00378F3592
MKPRAPGRPSGDPAGRSAVRAAGWETPVTVAELVDAGPLTGARMFGDGDSPVHQVRIVDELSVMASVGPHTAVVLTGSAARGGWAVEMAMRRAWEQAAACVIAPAGAAGAGSGELLAERLGVTLVFVEEDPLVTAVRVASAAASPQAARTQLLARCATRLAEAGASARSVLGVLNAELPGTAVALVDVHGTVLAGRRAAVPDATPHNTSGKMLAELLVPGPDGSVLGRLVATGAPRSPVWAPVVAAVLGLAVAPLTAWAATERLRAERSFAWQQALAERLLADAHEEDPRTQAEPATTGERLPDARTKAADATAEAAALGWSVHGPLTAFLLTAHAPHAVDDATARAALTHALGPVPVLRRDGGWAGWSPQPPDRLAADLARALATLPHPASAGLAAPAPGLRTLAQALLGAHAAALVAAPGAVARADRMGPAELLAALPAAVLGPPAHVVLAPLLQADRDGTLLRTLAAVLGEGGPLRAADKLGVHRNTVTTRLERVRAAGYDLDDPATRLALHLAVHLHTST